MFSHVFKKIGIKDSNKDKDKEINSLNLFSNDSIRTNSFHTKDNTIESSISSLKSIEPIFIDKKIIEKKSTEINISSLKSIEPIFIDKKIIEKKSTEINISSNVISNVALEEEVATIFSEGDNIAAINILKKHIQENQGQVDKRIWFMLLDAYQTAELKQDFDKTALAFAQLFGTSPPSWFGESQENIKESFSNGKNMIIFESIFKSDYQEKFKEFFKSARKEKFCRINVSQCKFEQNNVEVLEKILKLFVDLRKAKVSSVLMGDNNLINFCQTFIKNKSNLISLNEELLEHEQLIWLLYLEVLQWKGQQQEFENLAFTFAERFEISCPGWEDSGVMKFNSLYKESSENIEEIKLEKNININNVNVLLDFIKLKFEHQSDVEIDFSNILRVDFSAAGAISFHIQELWSNTQHSSKKVTLKYPNELIIVLLNMIGCTEFVQIIPRNRK